MQALTRLDAKTEGKKVLLGKLASSIRDSWAVVQEIPFAVVIVHLPRKRLVQESGIKLWREQDVVTCQRN